MKQVAPAPPPCNWQGFYFGLTAGGTWGRTRVTDVDEFGGPGEGIPADEFQQHWGYDNSGFVGAGELGYNWQPLNHLLLGFEADFGYLGLDGDGIEPSTGIKPIHSETNDGFFTTWRGRIGIPFNKWLFYATGGGIGASNDVRVFVSPFLPNGAQAGVQGDNSSDNFRVGWTVGGGVAYAFNCHWSVKAEYLYYDLGTDSFRTFDSGEQMAFFRWHVDTDGHIARVGLDYKF